MVRCFPRGAWVAWGAASAAWFALVYGGCNWLTARRAERVSLHHDWERAIPLRPEWIAVYLSVNLLVVLSVLILDRPRQWRALALALMAATALGGVGFLLLPAEVGYTVTEVADAGWAPWFDLKRLLVGRHNLCPSLHVAFTWICLAAYVPRLPRPLAAAAILWGMAVALSTLLVHEHHVIDVLAGAAVGALCTAAVYRPTAKNCR